VKRMHESIGGATQRKACRQALALWCNDHKTGIQPGRRSS
jgi:hypothetical protein